MRIFSCETHINHALDIFVAEEKTFPVMEKINEEKQLSTSCTYCNNSAIYLVAHENDDTTCR
ncbi:CxxH/CxxC protein [Psychrobacillus sp. FSL K6-4046]|uniref:CxxH/CxxC protein n=1 Tax=unclassified Psychrobacillus TaxID=2636677 RepID=UPI00146E2F6C|nr:CxxH/CxxC protein [Psychrobacillus sp. MER TA 171]NME06080.1 CxxH/CxxC protein [Psychrobacillus sp. BL-248-WT-3]